MNDIRVMSATSRMLRRGLRLVLGIALLLPLPPGASIVLALPLLVVAPQIVVDRQRLWGPEGFERLSVKRPALVNLLQRVLPLLARVETIVRPRLRCLTELMSH